MISPKLIKTLHASKHSPIDNYAGIPGLTSWLVGAGLAPNRGGTRMFTCSREHHENITPHSHRYELHCIVLKGTVTNITWELCQAHNGDPYMKSELSYRGRPGDYKSVDRGQDFYRPVHQEYAEGEEYIISTFSIHSIYFSRDAEVLVFESAPKRATSFILEPVAQGEIIRTFQIPQWAFQQRKEEK